MVTSRVGESIGKEGITVNRRKFLSVIGWGSISTAVVVFLLGLIRSMRPGVLYEPPTTLKASMPEA